MVSHFIAVKEEKVTLDPTPHSSRLTKKSEFNADYVANKATASLRSSAYAAGWPAKAGRNLRVVHDGGHNFSIVWPDDLDDYIMHLEMGDQDTPPTRLIHKFHNNILEQYAGMYDAAISMIIEDFVVGNF